MYDKDSWILLDRNGVKLKGVGEISIINGLSPDNEQNIDIMLHAGKLSSSYKSTLPAYHFGLEMLEMSSSSRDPYILYESFFTSGDIGIPINGLIWMGTKAEMFKRIKEKLDSGYRCLKLKIGAIQFEEEIALLKYVRTHFNEEEVILRLDANGAFNPNEVKVKLEALAAFGIHSIEQPIPAGQWDIMAEVCESSPVPVALDEELIGVTQFKSKKRLIDTIKPDFLILKPSLVGGFKASDEWIELAEKNDIGWWATSALESNIGLNAIAQWCFTKNVRLFQGLGTGQLYTNNFNSPLTIREGFLFYDPGHEWESLIPYLKEQ